MLSAHAAAALCAAIALGWPYGPLLAFALVALGVHAAWQHALLRSVRSIRAIEIAEAGHAVLELADGTRLSGEVGPRRHVTRFGVAMAVRGSAAKAKSILIAGDMLDANAFRALRIWALWSRFPCCSLARQGQ